MSIALAASKNVDENNQKENPQKNRGACKIKKRP